MWLIVSSGLLVAGTPFTQPHRIREPAAHRMRQVLTVRGCVRLGFGEWAAHVEAGSLEHCSPDSNR